MRYLLFSLCLMFSLTQAMAQYTEVYRSGRPGLFYGPYSMGKGMVAWESGVLYQAFPQSREGFTAYPQLLRVGLSEALEIRAFLTFQENGFGRLRIPRIDQIALTDIGFRYRFTENKGSLPAIALEMIWATPWVSDAFQPRLVRPYAFISTDNSLSSTLNLVTNFGLDMNNFGWTPYGFFRLALVNSFTGELAGYVEVGGNQSELGQLIQFDGGVTYMLTNDIQLDLSGGYGNFLSQAYYYAEMGISIRFPPIFARE
ncbi:MAG: hypothetical protein MRZ79_20225 [Bacteroidia bacterium]|nr:hypothetical protein [Bacteroidia bacterium]